MADEPTSQKTVPQALRDAADREGMEQAEGYALVVYYADGTVGHEYGGDDDLRTLGATELLRERVIERWADKD